MTVQQENRITSSSNQAAGELSCQPVLERCRETAAHAVDHNPMLVTLAVFGAGLGVGVMVASALADAHRPLPRQFSESVGRRVLESLSDLMPDSIGRHLPG